MAGITDLFSATELQQTKSLEVIARLVVEGFCSGLHRSPHKGFSVEFRQHRAYVAGDEIRHIDWKVFGRTDRFYIREYEEETNLRATILLDRSGSMGYGSGALTKLQYAVRVAACLAYLMLRQADGIGLVTFDQAVGETIPPRSRPGHLRVLLSALESCQPGGETELGKVFHEVARRLHRRGLLIIISDFFGEITELLPALAHFRHAHHEVLLLQILDRAELDFPFKEWMRFDSLENQDERLMVDPAQLRKTYLENLRRFQEELREGCNRHRIDLTQLVTDQPCVDALASYLALRARRS